MSDTARQAYKEFKENKLKSARSGLDYLNKEIPPVKSTGNIIARLLQLYELNRIKKRRTKALLEKRYNEHQRMDPILRESFLKLEQ